MSQEGIVVITEKLRELKREQEKQRKKLDDFGPVEEFFDLQKKGFEYIEAASEEFKRSKEFLEEIRRLASEERRLKRKIESASKIDRVAELEKLLSIESKIRHLENDLWILGLREAKK